MVECGSDHEQPRRDDGALSVDFAERYGPWAVISGDRMLGDPADPDNVAHDLTDNLRNGATFPPGPSPFGGVARRGAVELMSQGAAALHD